MEDETSQEDKMNILVQLFWICIAILESDYEHEFILGLRYAGVYIIQNEMGPGGGGRKKGKILKKMVQN